MNSYNATRESQKIHNKNIFLYIGIFIVTFILNSNLLAQNVLITDDSTYVPKSSAILDVNAVGKGILVPRVKLTSTLSALPVTLPDSSLMVYNYATAGDVTPGYYYWNGSNWVRLATGEGRVNLVTKTASTTLLKTETMVLASNDITLTLPVVTAADDGLCITVKNNGAYIDLVTVVPNGAATIDGENNSMLTRWIGKTYVASGGNWVVKEKNTRTDNLLDVSAKGSWTTIAEVVAFLDLHMTGPTVVRLSVETCTIDATQTIDLPYPVTFQGLSFGETTIAAAAGVSGTPLFNCISECYFKMIMFSALSNAAGNDGIHFTGSGTYHEVKDCYFLGFNKGIVVTNNSDLWVFETDFDNCAAAGIEIAANVANGGSIKVSESDFITCAIGISFLSGVSETVAVSNCVFYNTVAGSDIGILYTPATFTSFSSIVITNNAWNNQGTFISGFDFTRPDGRDANAFLQSNAGVGDSKPKCRINVKDNVSTTTITVANTYYKAAWVNTSSSTCKWSIANNKITYQTVNRTNGFAVITGNIACDHNSVLTIGLVKNGVSATRYGECNLKVTAANVPFQFSTVIYLEDISKNDYFELYVTSSRAGDLVTFQDVQWYIESK